jgi:spore maturation protein CgeB
MRIVYCETSAHFPCNPLFLEAFDQILGGRDDDFTFIDEAAFLGQRRALPSRIAHRLFGRHPHGYRAFNRACIERTHSFHPDLVLVCKGAYISPATLTSIRQETGALLVNYATDDPFNPINSTRSLVESIPLYDMYACTKRRIMADIRQAGCPRVIYVPLGYKPSVHFPEEPANAAEAERFKSDIVFIGGGDRDRFPYLRALIQFIPDLRLHLYGGYWDRDPVLARYYKGFAYGRELRLALSGTKIALNLVRRANRDGHVMRTFEIPACGAFMLAERTDEHLELFAEDKEAAYFESADEMVEKVRFYLAHQTERRCIADAGHRRAVDGTNTYKHRLVDIMNAVEPIRPLRTHEEQLV